MFSGSRVEGAVLCCSLRKAFFDSGMEVHSFGNVALEGPGGGCSQRRGKEAELAFLFLAAHLEETFLNPPPLLRVR